MPLIGIVGCGAVTHQAYGPVLAGRSEYRVRWLVDRDEHQARSAAALFGGEVASIDEAIEGADLLVIATPPATHADLVRRSLRPGRAILCEKPFVLRYEDATSLVEEAAAIGARLFVGHARRALPQVELARELVGVDSIGEVTGLSAREGGRLRWETVSNYLMLDAAGGGVGWDTGSHTLDMALFAANLDDAGAPTVEVTSIERDRPEPSNRFTARFSLRFDEQPISGVLELDRTQAVPNVITVHGTRGRVSFLGGTDNRVRLTAGGRSVVVEATTQHEHPLESVDLQFQSIIAGDDTFDARRFLGQIKILEALTGE